MPTFPTDYTYSSLAGAWYLSADGSGPYYIDSFGTAVPIGGAGVSRNYLGTVANQTAMLALSTAVKGDFCVRTDVNQVFELTTTGYSTLGNWTGYPQITVVNDLTTGGATSALSAAQGVALKGLVDTNTTSIATKQDASTAATLTGTQTLTNKTISGSSNTLSNIANSSLSTMATGTIKGNVSGSTAAPADVTLSALAIAMGIGGSLGSCTFAASVAPIAATAYASETVVATFDISGKIGTKGWFEINAQWTDNTTANNHTLRIRHTNISGTVLNQVNNNSSSNVDHYMHYEAWMKDSTTLNYVAANAETLAADNAVGISTETVNPSSFIIVVTLNTPTGGDTIALNSCVCKVFNPDAAISILSTAVTDFQEAVEDRVGALITAAGGVYDDTGGAIKLPVVFQVALSDRATALTTGTDLASFRAPHAFTLTEVRSMVDTASSSGLVTVDINESGTSVLSTKLSIDATEKTSTTAATPAVISDSAIADDAELTFDIVAAGTGAKGLMVTLIGTRP